MEKILVTGGCGFIGSHVVDVLINKGFDVVVLDNLSTGKKDNIPIGHTKLSVYHGCITDTQIVNKIIKNVSAIVHLAAISSVQASIENIQLAHKINFDGTLNLLESARHHNVKRFIFASSAAVYGKNNQLPLSENLFPEPLTPYACDKFACEQYIYMYKNLFDLNTTVFRFFNVFGPRQNPSSDYSGVITIFVNKALSNEPLTVFGDGKQSRDFVYVKDVVNVIAASLFKKELNGQVINIGSGEKYRLIEIVSMLESLLSKDLHIKYKPERHGDIRHSQANIEKLNKVFNTIGKTSVKDGLRYLINSL